MTGVALTKMDRFYSLLVGRRLIVLLIILGMTLSFLPGVLRIKSDVILSQLFPYNDPYVKLTARFSEVFGGGGTTVLIAVRNKQDDIFNENTLEKVKQITDEIELWREVYRIQTNSIASHATKAVKLGAQGSISVVPMMYPDVPRNKKDMEELKYNIFSNPAYDGLLVSKDGSAALITTVFKENVSYEHAFDLLRALEKKYGDEKDSIHITGFPMLMGWIYHHKAQMYGVFAISIGLMIFILFLIFRNLTGMLAPLALGIISTTIGLGFVGWTGKNFSPLLYVLAFLVGARIVSHAVQITHRYFEELHETGVNDKEKACFRTMKAMFMPNVAGVVTDAGGFLVLIMAKIILMQDIAVIMSLWMLSIAISAIVVPIICTFIPLRAVSASYAKKRSHKSVVDKIILKTTSFSIGSGKYIIAGGIALILAFSALQAESIKIGDPTPGSPILWPDHPYNRDQALINSLFDASSETFCLYYDGQKDSVYDPVVLNTFEQFSLHMAKALPDIYKTSMSTNNLVKLVNLTYRDGDQLRFQLPSNESELMSVMGLLRSAAGQAAILRFMDNTRERAQIVLFFADHTSDNVIRIRDAAYTFFKNYPMKVEKGEFKLAGGAIGMELGLNQEMKSSHAIIDGTVMAIIFVMCSISFRSLVAGIMLTLPLLISNFGAFAYMALNNIGLSVNTLPVAAVGVGVGVDFSIYLYSRCIEEFPAHRKWAETIIAATATCGKAIVFTCLTMVLAILPWFFISALKFQAQMGFFLAMLLLINLVLALTLHPLLLLIVKPKFITRMAKPH